MKIVYHHRVRSKDGQYVHIEDMVAALRRRGHEVVLVEPGGTARAGFGADAGGVARLKRLLPRGIYELLELAYGFKAAWRLLRVCARERPDFVYERYNLHLPAGAINRRFLGLPLLLEVNAPLAEERARHDGLGLPRLAARSEGAIWRAADVVLVVTEALAERARAARVLAERIAVIPNGIDLARFADLPSTIEAKRRLGLDGRLVLGFVGFVRPWHGLDRVLEIMAGLPRQDVDLLLVGDGPAREFLVSRARALGLEDRSHSTGVVEREAVPRHLAAFDMALQPAVVDYASPLKLFEYMAAGKAILAPDSANIREVLTHGYDAWLRPPEALAEALDTLLGDAALRTRLGDAARATILRRGLTWDANAARVEALASDLKAGRDRARRSAAAASSAPRST